MNDTVSIPERDRTRIEGKANWKEAPFRPFFLIASLDAIAGAAVWLPVALEVDQLPASAAAVWHRNALLFAAIPAMLAGFLLTALPRWTGRPRISSSTIALLVTFWITGRAASLLSVTSGNVVAAFFMVSLTGILAGSVIAAGDRRNVGVLLLLLGFCSSVMLTAATSHLELALRLGIASIVGLMTVIAGRVIPALTTAYLQSRGTVSAVRRSIYIEFLASTATVTALAAWVVMPRTELTGLLCIAASCSQVTRLMQWRGWQTTDNSSILTLHVGYCWIAVGFALMAAHILVPERLGAAPAIHAWTTGAFGTLGLAIMSSMIRRHTGRPFSRAMPVTAAYISMTLSCLTRLVAETPVAHVAPWITLSACLWMASFGLFLVTFASYLLPGASCRPAVTRRGTT